VIAILDYKTGNLASVQKALQAVGARTIVTNDLQVIRSASKLVLPGVGHFGSTSMLDQLGLRKVVLDSVEEGKPFLGICVGMQWLFQGSQKPALALLPACAAHTWVGIAWRSRARHVS